MQLNSKEVMELLSMDSYITATEISKKLNISPKTVRTRIKELSDAAKPFGVLIQSKPHYGFIFVEEKEGAAETFRGAYSEQRQGELPDSTEERSNFLLAYLINYDGYIKLDELSDFLCVSRSTLQLSIKSVEETLRAFDISIDRRPGYGIRAVGEEFDFRKCLGECFIRRNPFELSETKEQQELQNLATLTFAFLNEEQIHLSEHSFDNLIVQIDVAIKRIKRDRKVSFKDGKQLDKHPKEWMSAKRLAERLQSLYQIEYSEDEITYLAVYLAGRRMIGTVKQDESNFVIREEIDQLVLEMLNFVYLEFQIEFRNNFDIRMNLNQHMVPFDIRIRYNIPIHNDSLDDIKSNYSFAYTIAKRSCSILAEHYKKEISEDEIGYFSLIFALGLEHVGKNVQKSNILIVCGTGKGSARLLLYKYQKEFGGFINQIYVCSTYELSGFDFSKVDYVFTTIPINRRIPIPIVEVGQFLGKNDIVKVWDILENGHMDFLDDYYKKEQFFTDVEGKNKEEVLWSICHQISLQRKLPDGFFEAVLEREKLAQTSFGNRIAMPHPYKVMTDETFVYVAVLKNEVIWNEQPVQLVFLTAICDKEDANLSRFYEITTHFFLQKELINQVIKEKNFHILMQIMRQMN